MKLTLANMEFYDGKDGSGVMITFVDDEKNSYKIKFTTDAKGEFHINKIGIPKDEVKIAVSVVMWFVEKARAEVEKHGAPRIIQPGVKKPSVIVAP